MINYSFPGLPHLERFGGREEKEEKRKEKKRKEKN